MINLYNKSPHGKYSIELTYAGELHFGPTYFTAKSKGFSLRADISPISEDIVWSSNEKFVGLIKINSTPSGTNSELHLIKIESCEVNLVESCDCLITLHSIDDTGEIKYYIRESGERKLKISALKLNGSTEC